MRKLQTTLIILGCILIFTIKTDAQIEEEILDINLIGQKGDKWCWAASLQMVINHYRTTPDTVDQCEIGAAYFEQLSIINEEHKFNAIDRFYEKKVKRINFNCQDKCTLGNPSDTEIYNQPLGFNYLGITKSEFYPHNYDLILSEFGLNSMEDFNLLSWEQYKNEIDNDRPVLMLYSIIENDNTTQRLVYNHAVVAKGYFADHFGSFLVVNDPLQVCIGREYLLNKVVIDGVHSNATGRGIVDFDITQDIKIEKVLSMVHHIGEKTVTASTPGSGGLGLMQKIVVNPIIKKLKENEGRFFATRVKGKFSVEEFNKFNPRLHFLTDIEIFNYNYLLDTKERPNLKESFINSNIKEMTYSASKPRLKASVQFSKDGKTGIVEKISLEDAPIDLKVDVNGEIYNLENRENIGGGGRLKMLNYSEVKYIPYSMEFYRISINNEDFLIPKDRIAKDLFSPNPEKEVLTAIPADEVVTGLSAYTKKNKWEIDRPTKTREGGEGPTTVPRNPPDPPVGENPTTLTKIIEDYSNYILIFIILFLLLYIFSQNGKKS